MVAMDGALKHTHAATASKPEKAKAKPQAAKKAAKAMPPDAILAMLSTDAEMQREAGSWGKTQVAPGQAVTAVFEAFGTMLGLSPLTQAFQEAGRGAKPDWLATIIRRGGRCACCPRRTRRAPSPAAACGSR